MLLDLSLILDKVLISLKLTEKHHPEDRISQSRTIVSSMFTASLRLMLHLYIKYKLFDQISLDLIHDTLSHVGDMCNMEYSQKLQKFKCLVILKTIAMKMLNL